MRKHLIILTAICALSYALGLTSIGVTSWHEGQRLLVAREMLDAGEWIVPTINGHPYLAKPPLFYWVQMAIASIRGASVTLLDTRLAIALLAWLGVIATYFAARDICQPPATLAPQRASAWSGTAAFWAAAMLATSLRHTRAARVGELDIVLPALVTTAIWMVFRAWRCHLGEPHQSGAPARARIDWLSCAVGGLAATLAGLTKGPPALAVIAIGSYGAIMLHAARTRAPLRLRVQPPFVRERDETPIAPADPSRPLTIAGAILGAAIALAFSIPQIESSKDATGAALGAAMAATILGAIAPILAPTRARGFLAALSRTHPLLVLAPAVLVLYLWVRAVEARIDPNLLDAWAGEEVEDNLRPFRPASSVSILESASFAVGLGSLGAFATLAWLVWVRPRLRPGWFVLLAWALGGIALFSLFGKGLGRYALPVWPALAMLGGIGVAEVSRLASHRVALNIRRVLIVGIALLTLAHAAWYGLARALLYAHRSPRDFVHTIMDPALGVDPYRVFVFELYDPGIQYYLDAHTPVDARQTRAGAPRRPHTQPVGDIVTRDNLTGLPTWSLARLRRSIERRGPATIILRAPREGDTSDRSRALERLALGGLVLTELPGRGLYALYAGDSPIMAVRATLAPGAPPPGDAGQDEDED
ncbi:MAG: hypothetical protein H6809_02695 [Phycisphaeraceae bacterium]|nr:hypothetical protein [Phycisphaeraceae bacterium]